MKLQEFSDELRKDPNFVIAELQLKVEALEAQLAALIEQTRWIPVGERLPEESDKVLVWMECPDLFIAPQDDFGYYINGEWIGDNTDSMVHSKNVTHWMPLPPPPEVQND